MEIYGNMREYGINNGDIWKYEGMWGKKDNYMEI